MPEIDQERVTEVNTPVNVEAFAVTNFQLLPDNGGFILILGKRRFNIGAEKFGHFPPPSLEVFSAGFLSHAMLKDMSVVLTRAVSDFEKSFGHIPVPGLDTPKTSDTEN